MCINDKLRADIFLWRSDVSNVDFFKYPKINAVLTAKGNSIIEDLREY